MTSLYLRIADDIARQVSSGTLRAGEPLPSLRRLGRQLDVSMTTALQAYRWLESHGYLEARPRSGFYVRKPLLKPVPGSQLSPRNTEPAEIDTDAILSAIVEQTRDPANIAFGVACASPDLLPTRQLNRILRRIIREHPDHSARYDFGSEALRRQIARRALAVGGAEAPRDIVITSGGLEAIHLALRAVTRPGDVIAVESPTYFGILGVAGSLDLRVIEIPTSPTEGMDLQALEDAVRRDGVRACVLMTNCHNPLGYVLTDRAKQALIDLLARYDVPIVEDDVYGDLAFSSRRPRPLKFFDRAGLVILCGSFSKTLSPGYRVGWVATERFQAQVERLKLLTTVAAPSLSQLVIAEFLESGGYDRYLQRLQPRVAEQVELARNAIATHFPEGTQITRPAGGHMLWVTLPKTVKAVQLYRAALEQRISILPGTIFSPSARFEHHIRINCGNSWTPAHERALIALGRFCERAM